MVRAMVDALSRAGLSPGDIDLIMAHGTGTALNDQVEALSIREVFGDAVGRVLISGLKSMIGHTSGASGLVAVVTAIESLIQGCVPPTIGFETPIDEAESLDIVAGKARVAPVRTAQVNAFGFGGVNAVVIIGKTT
jgi:3-oxoacyl-[acyl-carrier-protein] synthase II